MRHERGWQEKIAARTARRLAANIRRAAEAESGQGTALAAQPDDAQPVKLGIAPLMVAEIEKIWSDAIVNGQDSAVMFARAIERAHGIGND